MTSDPDLFPGIFSEGKVYCYANFFCCANFSIVFGPNFWGGGKSIRGRIASEGAALPLVEESQDGKIDRLGRVPFMWYGNSLMMIMIYVLDMVCSWF